MEIILRALAVLVLSIFLFDTGSLWAGLVLHAMAVLAAVVFWPVIRRVLFPHT
ncbi:MAG: hypothetical protein WCH60_10650 [Burkholderiales bacterium]